MNTTNNNIENNNVVLYDVTAGQLVEWRGAVCEVLGTHDGGDWAVLKMKGGDRVPVRVELGEIRSTTAKKKCLPDWCKRGIVIEHEDGQKRIIASVGNTQVYFVSGGYCSQLASVMLHYKPAADQPVAPAWLVPGAKVKCRAYQAEVLEVEGMAVLCRCEIGNGETFQMTCTPDECEQIEEKPVYRAPAKSPEFKPAAGCAICTKKEYQCKGESIPYWEIKLGRKKVCEVNYPSEVLGTTSFKVSFPHIGMAVIDIPTLLVASEKVKKYLFEFFQITDIRDRQGYPFDLLCCFEDPLFDDVPAPDAPTHSKQRAVA